MRWLVTAAVLLVVATAAVAEPVDFRFSGPLPTRNFQPIQLIFLQLPFERPATIGGGELALLTNVAESNVISTSQGRIQASLKFETTRTVVGMRYGINDDWEAGIDMPFISRWGGFLDPIIDEVEGLFGSGNPERDLFPNNKFGDFIVIREDVVLFEGKKEAFRPGDLWFSVKRQLPLGDRWPLLALRAAVKAPTGSEDAVTGSGTTDIGLGLAAEYRPLRRLQLYANLDLVYPLGRVTPADLSLNPIFSESFAAELALSRRWSALLHQAVYTSPFHGNGARLLDGTVAELGLALNFAWKEWLGFQLLGINNVSGVEQAADFSLVLAVTARGRTVPFLRRSRAPLPPLSEEMGPPVEETPPPAGPEAPVEQGPEPAGGTPSAEPEAPEPETISPELPPLSEDLHRSPRP